MNPTATSDRAARAESVLLVVILLIVGTLAGLASFTHVKDWTLHNSPPGTGEWFGWANAAISELIPLASLLTIRRRKRTSGPIGYPMFLLICAVALSLAAQLAVAKPGLSGWLLSAVPALAFLGLSKLVLTTRPTPTPASVVPVKQPTTPMPPAPINQAAPTTPANPPAPTTIEQFDIAPRPKIDVPAPTVPAPALAEQPPARPTTAVPAPAVLPLFDTPTQEPGSSRRINGVPLTREVTR